MQINNVGDHWLHFLTLVPDHALHAVLAPRSSTPFVQINEVGEAVLEVGAPAGWGPVGMTPERMETAMQRLKDMAARHSAGVSMLRPSRQVEVQTATGPGES